MPAVNIRQAFLIMPYNNEFVESGYAQGSNDPISNAFANYNTYYGYGNTGLQDTIIGHWFNPGIEQDKEFAQQVSLQMYQNEWNSESEKMARMKKAGINANVAAAGIAGAGSAPSTSAPNSSIGAGAAGVTGAAQLAGTAVEGMNAATNAFEKFTLTGAEKERKKAEVSKLLAEAFHNEWLGRAVAEMLPLQKENERADTWLKLANFDKAREEKKLISKRILEAEENITRIKNEASLLEKQGNVADATKLKIDAQTAQIKLENDKLQWDKDFREKWHFDNTKPIDNALVEAMMFEQGESDGAVNTIGNAIGQVNYFEQKGFNKAEIEDAFDKAYNEGLGNEASAADYSKMKYEIEIAKTAVSAYLEALAAGAKNPITFLIQKLMVPALKGASEEYEKGVHKPQPKPHSR